MSGAATAVAVDLFKKSLRDRCEVPGCSGVIQTFIAGPGFLRNPKISPPLDLSTRGGNNRRNRQNHMIRHLALIFASTIISLAAHNELTPEEKKDGWKLLFDGKTTSGWRSFNKPTFPEKGWTVKDGELRLEAGSKAGDIVTEEKFSDFDLTWEWKIPPGANNGIKYFILEERGQALGHEYQMIDESDEKKMSPKHRTASFYEVLPPAEDKPLKPPGEWNTSRVFVQGNHVEHWLNGKKVLEYELGSDEVLKAVQNSKFKTVEGFGKKQNGHILLTYHNDPVSYRNIKIRPHSKK